MQPFSAPIPEAPANATCCSCEAPLEPGQRFRCLACVRASEIAVERAGGRTVLPSMIAAVRAETDAPAP